MKIHEYQGKQLLKKYGVNVPEGLLATSVDEAYQADVLATNQGQVPTPGDKPRGGVTGSVSIRGRKVTGRSELSKDETADGTGIGTDNMRLHKRPGSKIAYAWKGDKQVRWVVDYPAAGLFFTVLRAPPSLPEDT